MTLKKTFIYIFLLIVILALVSIARENFIYKHTVSLSVSNTKDTKQIKLAGVNLTVDLATDDATREQGLSARNNLSEDQGMLFIFDTPGHYAFWMKDMNFPIDMIWIDQNLKVVYIQKDAEPSSYPNLFTPKVNAKYVLEVFSGFSEKNNLKIGDSVQFLSS